MYNPQNTNTDLFKLWNSSSWFLVQKYNFNQKAALLTLLYYQFCFLKELNDDKRVCSSFFEENIKLNIVVVSRDPNKKRVILKRQLFDEEIYNIIKVKFGTDTNPIIIDESLLNAFEEIYKRNRKELNNIGITKNN